MSEPVSNVVDVIVNIMGGGLSSPDLGVPCFFFKTAKAEDVGVLSTWYSADEAKKQYADKPDLYEHMLAWESLSSRPMLTFPFAADGSYSDALGAAREKAWFYRPFLVENQAEGAPAGEYIDVSEADALAGAIWCEANVARADFTCTSSDALIPDDKDNLLAKLKDAVQRRLSAPYSKDRTASTRTGAVMSMTDYTARNGYRDSEFKKIGIAADDITPTNIATLQGLGAYYNVSAQSVASETSGRLRNTMTHSPYSESISEVEAIDSLVLGLQADLANFIENQDNLPQTYSGQQSLINQASKFLKRYNSEGNGFLGVRSVTHPITKEEVTVDGFIMVTQATDIDNLTTQERREYKAAPLVIYIYPAGSIHAVKVTLNVIY